ncbi:MAG: hypothetical protein HC876_12615 [Chloroflexaceae bacterium]|nr:hypothetical protein [Chloroflexaceae bacterium]
MPTDTPVPTNTPAPTDTPTPVPTPTATPIITAGGYPMLQTNQLEFGAVAHLFYTDYERVLQLTKNAGFDWVRQQVHWKDIEWKSDDYGWERLDEIVEAVDRYDLKLMVSIVRSPTYYTADGSDGLPADPVKLGDFVEDMALRYGDKIDAYQIWNEQNLAHETGGRITFEDAGRYVEMLVECYRRIKAVNPNAYVVTGALSPTGYTSFDESISDIEYLRAMYEYRDGLMNGHFDVQAVHAAGSANPPDTLYPDNPSNAQGWTNDSTFYFRNIENIRAVMEAYGYGEHQVWITEYGWATENVTPGYEYGNQVSFEQQAQYIGDAMLMAYEQYPWVGNMILWNMNFAVTWNEVDPPQPLHEQSSFGLLNPDWSPRPSFLRAQDTIAIIKREQGRAE